MTITVTVKTSNHIFQEHPELELYRIFKVIANKAEAGWYTSPLANGNTEYEFPIHDQNGNLCGLITVENNGDDLANEDMVE